MGPANDSLRLLQEIRDEVRRSSARSEARFEKMDRHVESIATSLRDLAQQMAGIRSNEKLGGH